MRRKVGGLVLVVVVMVAVVASTTRFIATSRTSTVVAVSSTSTSTTSSTTTTLYAPPPPYATAEQARSAACLALIDARAQDAIEAAQWAAVHDEIYVVFDTAVSQTIADAQAGHTGELFDPIHGLEIVRRVCRPEFVKAGLVDP